MITIIPAIDIIDGQCVRLTRGMFDTKKVYNTDPLEVAKEFEGAGITRLHMVDLDGARTKKIVNAAVLENVASNTSLVIDFGGGIQSDEDIRLAFNSGAAQVTAGSIAVKNKKLVQSWLQKYGTDKIILGADSKDGKIAVSGWQEKSHYELIDFLKEYQKVGFQEVISTDVTVDGMLTGPSIQIYHKIKNECPNLKLIASGGVASVKDIENLDAIGIEGVIVGKAIYEGKIELSELKDYLC